MCYDQLVQLAARLVLQKQNNSSTTLHTVNILDVSDSGYPPLAGSRARRSPEDQGKLVSMRAMAAATLGPAGASGVSVAYLALAYALLVAYSVKVGELSSLAGGTLAPEAAQALLTATFFSLLLTGTSAGGLPCWTSAQSRSPAFLCTRDLFVYSASVPLVCGR